MKTRILIPIIVGLLYANAFAQTADDWVAQGRSYLAAQDIVDANYSFAQALAIAPTNETANAFYAITRLLVLPSRPAGSNFLTRLGFPLLGRNIYAWTSQPPKDTNGIPLAPTGVDADEFTAQLRTNALPAIAGAIGNLSTITDTNFVLDLASNETTIAGVTLDYGDFKLIQAALYGAEYVVYMLNAQNLDAQLTDLRALYTNGILSAGEVLSYYPQLFTFATTNDLQNACAAFTNAVNTYFKASAFIRSRSTNEVRLFNYDQVSAQSEADFRLTLQDLKNSLVVGPQMLALDPNLTVDMTLLFAGSPTCRSLLPRFDGNAIELGSFPDLSFGGVIDGLTAEDVEGYLGKYFRMLPVGRVPELSPSNTVNLAFTTLSGHYYALETSTSLTAWQVVAAFTASSAVSVWTDSPHGPECFYRLRDDTGFMTFSGVVLDQNTSLPIAGAQVQSLDDGTTVFTDPNGQFYLHTTLPTSWYWDELEISALGYSKVDGWYYGGSGLVSGLQIYLSPPPVNDNFANRIVLTGSTLSTNGNNLGATWETGEPPDAYSGYGNKSVWFAWTAPTTHSYVISVSTVTVYDPILAIYTGTQLSTLSKLADIIGSGYYAGYTLSATAGQTYQIEIDDYYGNGGPYTLSIAPSP